MVGDRRVKEDQFVTKLDCHNGLERRSLRQTVCCGIVQRDLRQLRQSVTLCGICCRQFSRLRVVGQRPDRFMRRTAEFPFSGVGSLNHHIRLNRQRLIYGAIE